MVNIRLQMIMNNPFFQKKVITLTGPLCLGDLLANNFCFYGFMY